MRRLYWFTIILIVTAGCSDHSKLKKTLSFSGSNRDKLEKVLQHYKKEGDKEKLKAAEFLLSNMDENKYWFEGDILTEYDEILLTYDSLRREGIIVGDPPVINQKWNSIVQNHGVINENNLNIKYDCQVLDTDFLIKNIDEAFLAWKNSPLYNADDFDLFCEYILPYRIQNEPVEPFRKKYYSELKQLVDSFSNVRNLVLSFHNEFYWNRKYRASNILWEYPLELPISKMEIGRRGSCRQLTTFFALIMRACGLPVTIDRAIWANRSSGHEWNVLILENGRIFPFDALDRDSLILAYKPAKIFRKTFSNTLPEQSLYATNIPKSLISENEKDVTGEYVQSYDIAIPVKLKNEKYANVRHGVICVFDNQNWIPVYWGIIKSDSIHFKNMASDVAYLAAFYDNDMVIPASEPFLLQKDGKIQYCRADNKKIIPMRLERKYPLMKRVEDFAWGLRRTNAEGSDNANFENATRFFSIYNLTYNVTDANINNDKKFRYVRLNSSMLRHANFAEVEFYGKKDVGGKEEKLNGKIIGFPPVREEDPHSYIHAMDGNLDTWFQKPKDEAGWVGLDLGKGNERIITRIRYCPRSDTNFIVEGDEYELLYWDNNGWQSAGKKTAAQFNYINYEKVPSGTIYLLRNHTRGKEERIFTYENGEQIWW